MAKPRRYDAFTLVELLVVVTVVGVAAGLLLPAVQASRTAARRATCQSNLRQWALATQSFADAHQGALPRRGQGVQPTEKLDRMEDWFNALPPFMESEPLVVLAAADREFRPSGAWTCPELEPTSEPQYFAFGMNMWLSTYHSPQADNLKSVGELSTMALMADGAGNHCSLLPSKESYSPMPRHAGRVNVSFLDGHVQSFDGEDLGCGVGLVEHDAVRWKVPGSLWEGPHD